MLRFVGRGHWRATAGEKGPLVSVSFLKSCSVAFGYPRHLGHTVVLTLQRVWPALSGQLPVSLKGSRAGGSLFSSPGLSHLREHHAHGWPIVTSFPMRSESQLWVWGQGLFQISLLFLFPTGILSQVEGLLPVRVLPVLLEFSLLPSI